MSHQKMESFPFVEWYTSEQSIRETNVKDVDTDRVTSWAYSTDPRARSQFVYYDDEGVPRFRSFITHADHDLGVDAVPSLIEESETNSGTYSGKLFKKWLSLRILHTEFDKLSSEIRDRGRFYSRDGTLTRVYKKNGYVKKGQPSRPPVVLSHTDTRLRDVGQALSSIVDEDKAYHYTRTSLLRENSEQELGELSYFPLSVLAHLVKGDDVEILTQQRFEYDVLMALRYKHRTRVTKNGITLDGVSFIQRQNVEKWVKLADEVLGSLLVPSASPKKTSILEDVSYEDYIGRLSSEVVYVISRKEYSRAVEERIFKMIEDVENAGYQHRGSYVYRVLSVKSVIYPIYLFSKKRVNVAFPPVLPSLPNNNAPKVFPDERAVEYSTRSTGKLGAPSYDVVGGGSITYYGAFFEKVPVLRDQTISLGREGGDERDYIVPVLLPTNPKLVRHDRGSVPSEFDVKLSRVYHDPLTYTTVKILVGRMPKGDDTRKLITGWLVTRIGTDWYAHSSTAKSITQRFWTKLAEAQSVASGSLPVTLPKTSRLSLSSAIRHWASMRYEDDVECIPVLGSEGLQNISEKGVTNLSYFIRNQFGALAPYTLPARTNASPCSSYPLPIIQEVNELHRIDEGELIRYKEDGANPVVRVVNGEVSMHDPYSDMTTKVDVEDGLYDAELDEELTWRIIAPSTKLEPWSEIELIDYSVSFMYKIQEDDLKSPPSDRIVEIVGPAHLSGSLESVVARDAVTVSLDLTTPKEFAMFLGRSDPRMVSVDDEVTFEYKTKVGDLWLHTNTQVFTEYEYHSLQETKEDLLSLVKDQSSWNVKTIPKRTFLARDHRDESLRTSYYVESEDTEVEVSCVIGNLLLYYTIPSGYEVLLDEFTHSELAANLSSADLPDTLKLVSRNFSRRDELKATILSAMF